MTVYSEVEASQSLFQRLHRNLRPSALRSVPEMGGSYSRLLTLPYRHASLFALLPGAAVLITVSPISRDEGE